MKKAKGFKQPVAKQLPSGSWFCRVRVNGKDIPITKPTRKEAEAEAMAVKYGIIEAKEKKEEKKLELVHQQSIYKMIIPQEVEKKIRLLCREIHNVEWSGVLFYKVSGSFEDKSLTITCVDLFQMDEGTGGYTEYDMSPDVMGYMVDHPELLEADVYQGLIH